MELHTQTHPGLVIISMRQDRIDASSAIQFKDQMRELTANGPPRVILNLEQVGFIDSSGLGAIVTALKQLRLDQTLELAALSPTVQKVFELTRMNMVFRIHDNLDCINQEMAQAG